MKLRGFIAAAAVLLSGCSISGADTPSGVLSSAESAGGNIVASPTNGAEGMDITREEYLGEYLYFLAKNGFTSDTDQQTLEQAQQQVIDSMIEERIIRVEFAENGMTLTDSDRSSIRAETDAGIASLKASMKSAAAAMDSSLTDEELDAKSEEQYGLLLSTCGITEDTFYGWQETLFMRQKLSAGIAGEETVADEEIGSQLNALIAVAREEYTQSPETYFGQNYAGIWIPDGSRKIQAILVSFDYDTYAQIVSLRGEGKDDEADKLREDSLDGLQERYERVMARIVAGDDFGSLMEEFNEDEGNGTFLVTPGTEVFGKEFLECAMGIDAVGGTDTAVTDYGYYILRYESEAVVTEEALNAAADQIRGYILDSRGEELFGAQMEKWKNEYAFEINKDMLGI